MDRGDRRRPRCAAALAAPRRRPHPPPAPATAPASAPREGSPAEGPAASGLPTRRQQARSRARNAPQQSQSLIPLRGPIFLPPPVLKPRRAPLSKNAKLCCSVALRSPPSPATAVRALAKPASGGRDSAGQKAAAETQTVRFGAPVHARVRVAVRPSDRLAFARFCLPSLDGRKLLGSFSPPRHLHVTGRGSRGSRGSIFFSYSESVVL